MIDDALRIEGSETPIRDAVPRHVFLLIPSAQQHDLSHLQRTDIEVCRGIFANRVRSKPFHQRAEDKDARDEKLIDGPAR